MSAKYRRNRPFLHRNFISATNVGLKASSPSHQQGDKSVVEDDFRPAKRRRLAESPASLDGITLCDGLEDRGRSLRIDVCKITHKDLARVRFNTALFNGPDPPFIKEIIETQVRCKITISCQRDGLNEVLFVDTQIFAVKASKNPIGTTPVARFCSQPFFVPEEKIFVQQDDDDMFSLANNLAISIELSSASSSDCTWPPLGLGSHRHDETLYGPALPRRQWTLTAANPNIFQAWSRSSLPISLRRQRIYEHDLPTEFVLQVDIAWKQPIASPTLEAHKLLSITVDGEKAPPVPLFSETTHGITNGITNGINGSTPELADKSDAVSSIIDLESVGLVDGLNSASGLPNGIHILNGEDHGLNGHSEAADTEALALAQVNGVALDGEELVEGGGEGELTPSRSRRAKQGINYNVRQMMNTALGRETRKRRKPSDQEPVVDECGVTYLFPPEQIHLPDFFCVLCRARNNSHTQLMLHLRSHSHYEFQFASRPRGGYQISVMHNEREPWSPIRTNVFQLGLPLRPLNLEKFLEGDESWVTSRLGPDNGRDVHRIVLHAKQRSPQSRQPTKSTFADRLNDRQRSVRRTTKKPPVLVPKIKQPLFDPISKAELVPGTEIRTHKVDTAWLVAKHRDTLQDYNDMAPEEKEFMTEWDAFMHGKMVSSEKYLGKALVAFAKAKAPWIIAHSTRAQEYAKHAAMLLTKGAITAATFAEANQKLNEARVKKLEPPKEPQRQPSSDSCGMCHKPVPISEMLICSNKLCKTRVHHDGCVRDGFLVSKDADWLCQKCSAS